MANDSISKPDHKKDIRKQIRCLREAQTEQDCLEKSKAVCSRILSMDLFSPENIRGKKIALYYAHKGEVDLSFLRDRFIASGAVCYYPITYPDCIFMEVFDPDTTESLQTRTGAMGIREPIRKSGQAEKMDIILIPGVAFDMNGNRIGHGKGYYDRYLQACDPDALPILVAPAYEFQLFPYICCEKHDIPVHYIVTEKRVIFTR